MAASNLQTTHDSLSKRAVEILGLLSEGLSDREIAEQLVMTINTVKWYNRQIYSILGVSSRTQAIARASELHLLSQEASDEHLLYAALQTPTHNLPAQTTRFIGRKTETAGIKHLLLSHRLVTLTGPPGTGKTRLALNIAYEVLNLFSDGVYLVSLAAINDASLVANAIATAIGVNEVRGQSIVETLKHALQPKKLLLVIDNFEHLLDAAPLISELLASTSHLKILTTSREALHLYGEQEYAVPLLDLPNPEHPDPVVLAACDSVALFIERAKAVQSDFQLTPDNALTIAKICVRLEGLPLALELAAARIKLLTPQALLARLSSRLDVLVSGPRDLPTRQRTLRQTIDWSYELLSDEEKRLFARLAIFRGGCSLEAVDQICIPGLSIDSLEGIDSLLNKSLLFQQEGRDGEPHFIMLETIHEYAWEQLEVSGEAEELRQRHAAYYVDLVERAEPELRLSNFAYWMARLTTENDNLRAVLEWSLEGGDVLFGLRLIGSLHDYLILSGQFMDGRAWALLALEKSDDAPPNVRAKLLITTTNLLFYFSQAEQQTVRKQLLEQAVVLARETDDRLTLAWALTFLGSASIGLDAEYSYALDVTEEGLAIFRSFGHKPGMAQALNVIGELTRTQGNDQRAWEVYEECLRLVRETGELRREAMNLSNMGFIAVRRGEITQAHRLFREGLEAALWLGYDKHLIVTNTLAIASTIALRGDLKRAVTLIGAAEAWLEFMHLGLQPGNRPEYEQTLAFIHSHMDASTVESYLNEGHRLSFEDMIVCALEASEGSYAVNQPAPSNSAKQK